MSTPTTTSATMEVVDTGARPLDTATAGKLKTIGIAAGVAGVVLVALGFAVGGQEFNGSYLTGVMWAVTIALGGLFWPLVWRVTKAGWPVAARRHMEWLAGFLPLMFVLILPIVLQLHDIYEWTHEEIRTDPIVSKKVAWLSEGGFIFRAFAYITIWNVIYFVFRRFSFKQDQTGEIDLTLKAQWWSPLGIILFALSISFAGFDWAMSLSPHWFSTIYGVLVFAGGAVTSLASVSLITVYLRSKGVMGKITTIEHQHDVGKLFFAFIVFWAYIAFSQFILIWYANIPEETIYFRHRWENGWKSWSLLLLFGHFFVPFIFMLSRWAKRINWMLVVGAVWMLVMHFVDWYWMVRPNFGHGGMAHVGADFHFTVWDIVGWLGPALLLLAVVLWQMAKGPLYPIRDPRIKESMRSENI
jgi:hypothetical protein